MQKKLLTLILITLLSGCASMAPAPKTQAGEQLTATGQVSPAETWAQRQSQLSAIHNWTLNSVISLRDAQKVTFANLRWQQSGREYEQNISGPFNIGGARIEGEPGNVTLWQSAQEKYTATTPEGLVYKATGFSVPISSMVYWVRGIPVPGGKATTQLDAQNRLSVLRQQGWQINYLDYTTVNGMDLPSTIQMSNGPLQMKMVIKQWRV